MPDHDAPLRASNEAGEPGEPTESAWLQVSDRRYKVVACPRKTPTFVIEWCTGGLVMSLVGLVVLAAANRGETRWCARVYWQKKRWYNGRYHQLVQEDFADEGAAKARAAELTESLQAGTVPIGRT